MVGVDSSTSSSPALQAVIPNVSSNKATIPNQYFMPTSSTRRQPPYGFPRLPGGPKTLRLRPHCLFPLNLPGLLRPCTFDVSQHGLYLRLGENLAICGHATRTANVFRQSGPTKPYHLEKYGIAMMPGMPASIVWRSAKGSVLVLYLPIGLALQVGSMAFGAVISIDLPSGDNLAFI